ncbi:MAG: S24 family peptidase [Alphaproteobacteria bacterium]|nr:LexA family transcriptional regulator [Rhodospirillaceae bacterium]MBT7646526.1 LexA family transcriptional regulator [Rhodospirillaceae bacterium]MDG2482914.1 S24 family peptidase [Alphaproteobacteria bacterium]
MNDTQLVRELRRRMALARLSQKRLALVAGLNETAVRDIIAGRSRHPRHDTLEKLAVALDCTVTDLIDERGGPSARTGEDSDAFMLVARYDPEQHQARESLTQPNQSVAEIAFQASWLATLTPTPVNQLTVVVMDGDSMAPGITSGDSLLVDLTEWSPGADGIYVLRNNGGLLVKRLSIDPLRQLVAIGSDNPAYPPLNPIPLTELDLVGRVIWVGHRV